MTWQNGNQDDVYGRLNNTKDIGFERHPFIGEGDHKLVVISLEEFNHAQHGPSVRATFEVMESQTHQQGTRVVKLWNLTKPSKFPATQENDSDRFADFCRKLKGAPKGHPIGNDIRVLMKERAAEQLARGMLIKARGANTAKQDKKPWVEVYWENIAQSPEQIASWRTRIENRNYTTPAPSPAVAPVLQTSSAAPTPPAPSQGFLAQLPPEQKSGW